MNTRDKTLVGIYALVAAGALVATWWNNLAYFAQPGNDGILGFIRDGYANHAAASLTNDVILVAVAAIVWMFVEAHRIGLRHAWVYAVLSVVIAISVAFPLFLIARQRKLAAARSEAVVGVGREGSA
ncbi:DUF2834 domain-containing protein [Amycolatopsis anabasis]|uniref:DUF2834 domain-containing protein n=1 Tax=Amycolatopsis anabasis TaxID=1840409 RepID=UPI00131ABABA|nr:DUF2834 domain-containing protein [Amycolatopsis anabasis]